MNILDKLRFSIRFSRCFSTKNILLSGIKCELGVCKGYNTKRNLFELNHVFLSPLLRYHTPQALSDQILGLLLNLNNIKITVFDVINALQSHLPKPDSKFRHR